MPNELKYCIAANGFLSNKVFSYRCHIQAVVWQQVVPCRIIPIGFSPISEISLTFRHISSYFPSKNPSHTSRSLNSLPRQWTPIRTEKSLQARSGCLQKIEGGSPKINRFQNYKYLSDIVGNVDFCPLSSQYISLCTFRGTP